MARKTKSATIRPRSQLPSISWKGPVCYGTPILMCDWKDWMLQPYSDLTTGCASYVSRVMNNHGWPIKKMGGCTGYSRAPTDDYKDGTENHDINLKGPLRNNAYEKVFGLLTKVEDGTDAKMDGELDGEIDTGCYAGGEQPSGSWNERSKTVRMHMSLKCEMAVVGPRNEGELKLMEALWTKYPHMNSYDAAIVEAFHTNLDEANNKTATPHQREERKDKYIPYISKKYHKRLGWTWSDGLIHYIEQQIKKNSDEGEKMDDLDVMVGFWLDITKSMVATDDMRLKDIKLNMSLEYELMAQGCLQTGHVHHLEGLWKENPYMHIFDDQVYEYLKLNNVDESQALVPSRFQLVERTRKYKHLIHEKYHDMLGETWSPIFIELIENHIKKRKTKGLEGLNKHAKQWCEMVRSVRHGNSGNSRMAGKDSGIYGPSGTKRPQMFDGQFVNDSASSKRKTEDGHGKGKKAQKLSENQPSTPVVTPTSAPGSARPTVSRMKSLRMGAKKEEDSTGPVQPQFSTTSLASPHKSYMDPHGHPFSLAKDMVFYTGGPLSGRKFPIKDHPALDSPYFTLPAGNDG